MEKREQQRRQLGDLVSLYLALDLVELSLQYLAVCADSDCRRVGCGFECPQCQKQKCELQAVVVKQVRVCKQCQSTLARFNRHHTNLFRRNC